VKDKAPDMFGKLSIPPELEAYLRDMNPWWEGKPGPRLPTYRRWAFDVLLSKLHSGLAPAVVLKGARQVGKTTLQEQAIQYLIQEKSVAPRRVLRVQFEDLKPFRTLKEPILEISRWFQNCVLGETLNEAAHRSEPAYIFLDEAQNLKDWAPQLKMLVDHNTVHAVVTGSSALRIESGRDSLAGRITSLELGTLLLREIAALRFGETLAPLMPANGLRDLLNADFWHEAAAHGRRHLEIRNQAFNAFSERGGYPIGHARPELDWAKVADQLNETVIRRVIQHDLRLGDVGRKRDPELLEEVFRLACRYAGQAPGQAIFVTELRQALQANVAWQRILSYFRFLEGALLIRLARPLELRLKRRKGNSKVCIVDHGLRASWLEEVVPLDAEELEKASHLSDLAGHIAESVVGAFLADIPSLDLAHFPARGAEPEVDYILTIGDKRIPLEVKYRRRIDPLRDTLGLRSFLEKAHYNAPFGILVTMLDDAEIRDPRIVPVSLPSLLLMR
jgi:predicted AAA+ superfamily ATPase